MAGLLETRYLFLTTLSDEDITKDMVVSAMGLPQDEKVSALLSNYKTGNIVEISRLLKDLLSSGVKAETLAEEIITLIIDNPSTDLLKLLGDLPNVKAPFAEAKLLVALTSQAPVTVQVAQPAPSTTPTNASEHFDKNAYFEKILELNDAVQNHLCI